MFNINLYIFLGLFLLVYAYLDNGMTYRAKKFYHAFLLSQEMFLDFEPLGDILSQIRFFKLSLGWPFN